MKEFKHLGNLIESMGLRICMLVNVPMMIDIGDVVASPVKDLIEENINDMERIFGTFLDPELDEEDAEGVCLELQQHLRHGNPDYPIWLAEIEIPVPHNVQRSGNDYNYSSHGWGIRRCALVASDTLSGIVEEATKARKELFEKILEDESNADDGSGYDNAL